MTLIRILIAVLSLSMAVAVQAQDAAQTTPCHEPQCPIAKRGTAVVTVADVMAKLMTLEPRQRDSLLSDAKQVNAMIENLLITRQIANDFDSSKIDQNPALKARLLQAADDVLAVQRLDEIRAARIKGNYEQLAREYYLANKSEMHTPLVVSVRHLLISAENRGAILARAEISTLHEQLKSANSSQFAEKVLELSDDPSKTSNGGVIKVIEGNKDLAAEFTTAALSLTTPGEVSLPVQTDFGYHLLQLIERQEPQALTFEQAKPRIVAKIQRDIRRRVVGDYRGELMAQGELEIFPDNLAGLVFGDVPEGTDGSGDLDEGAK